MLLVTVGHGTLPADELAALLRGERSRSPLLPVELVVDVRTYPGSRRNPQFTRQRMESWLPQAGIGYRWEPRLGGRRQVRPDSRNVGLRDASFRAYADHMAGSDFREALAEVLGEAEARAVAVMCAESVWWRCHRRLIADAVELLHGVAVHHLFHDGRVTRHAPTPGARVEGTGLVYDSPTPDVKPERDASR